MAGQSRGDPLPVTAKLSKAFYEHFGEQLTNEMVDWFNSVDATYKSDLKEHLDALWARFDARLDQRAAELRAEMMVMKSELRGEIKSQKSEIEGDMKSLKSELLVWMFGLWVTTLLALVALR